MSQFGLVTRPSLPPSLRPSLPQVLTDVGTGYYVEKT